MVKKLNLLFFSLFVCILVYADDSGTLEHATNITWTFNSSTKTLTISGEGGMDWYDDSDNDEYEWYTHYSEITSIVVNEGVTNIEESAFQDYPSLVKVSLPSTITYIGNYAFKGNTKLTQFTCMATTPPTLSANTFYNVSGATLLVPNSVKSSYTSWSSAFSSVVGITTSTGKCGANLTWTYNSGSGLLTISGTGSMYSFDGEDDDNPGWYDYMSSITNIYIGEGVTSIGGAAFSGCSSLLSVSFPSTLQSIGYAALSSCKSLTEVEMPEGLTTIRQNAFAHCTGLITLVIPMTVTSIGDEAFYDCTSITNIRNMAFTPQTITSTTFPKAVYSQAVLYVPAECATRYKAATNWKSFTVISELENSDKAGVCGDNLAWKYDDATYTLTFMGTGDMIDYTFYSSNGEPQATQDIPWWNYRTKIKTISFCDGMTSISKYAFYGFTGIESVSLPSKVTTIGVNAFMGCTSLTSVVLPTNLTTIGTGMFYQCSNLKSVSLPSKLTTIGANAFGYCSSLASLTIPATLTTVWGEAFKVCTSLSKINISNLSAWCNVDFVNNDDPKWPVHQLILNGTAISDLVIPADVTKLNKYPFNNCSSLTSVTIPNTITEIAFYPFAGCENLTDMNYNSTAEDGLNHISSTPNLSTLVLGDNVTEIGSSAFVGCKKLESVYVSSSVTEIKPMAFMISSVNTVTFADNSKLTTIGYEAFRECRQLTSVNLPSSLREINYRAFDYCTSLTNLTIPSGVTYIADNVFSNTGMTSFNLPASVTDFGGDIRGNKFETITVDEGNTVYYSGSYNGVFERSSNRLIVGCKNTTYPSDVTEISQNAFGKCEGLTSVTIPSTVTVIGDSAFSKCPDLDVVYIPISVATIGEKVFEDCASLENVHVSSETPIDINANVFSGISENATLYVPNSSCIPAYQNATGWSQFANIEVESYVLSHSATSFVNTEEMQYGSLSYSRSYGTTNAPLYIPMRVNVADIEDNFDVYKLEALYMFDEDGDGTYDESVFRIGRIKSGILKPNNPYVIRAKVKGTYSIPSYDNILYKSEKNSIDCSTTELTSTFTGNYVKEAVGKNFYVLNGGEIKYYSSTVSLPPFYWYMTLTNRDGQTITLLENVKIRFVSDDDATAIAELDAKISKDKTIEGYYSVDGKKNAELLPGVNIIRYVDGTIKKMYLKK